MAHTVTAPTERANVVQAEFAKYREQYMDSMKESADNLVQSTLDLIEQGDPVRADYHLRSWEAFTEVISHEAFQTYMQAALAAGNPA